MTNRIMVFLFAIILTLTALSCSDEDKITAAFQDGSELGSGARVPFLLEQNQPNPFDPVTAIIFRTSDTMMVTIKVYTEDWQEIATVIDNKFMAAAGLYEVVFNPGMNFPSGDYYYTMEARGMTQVRMMKCVK